VIAFPVNPTPPDVLRDLCGSSEDAIDDLACDGVFGDLTA
jgi:hypothetical protein